MTTLAIEMTTCSRCGTTNTAAAKFCPECGAPLVEVSSEPVTRRLVTILFADVVGSTAMGEHLDAEAVRAVLQRYFAKARSAVERHGGTVEKFIGDAVMAVFGMPLLHEDDALRAARAAVDLLADIERLNEQIATERGLSIEFRIGVNTGHVVVGGQGSETLVTGDAVNVAARLEQAAAAGDILVGEATYRLIRDYADVEPVAPITAKGKAQTLLAFRLTGVTSARHLPALGRRSAFVGREAELRLLREMFQMVRMTRQPELAVLLGPAGIGKSRLVDEFAASVDEVASVVRGRCLPYGEGITWWPIAQIVRAVAVINDDDDVDNARQKIGLVVAGAPESRRVAEVVAGAIGLGETVSARAEIFWAFQTFLVEAAARRPLVCVVDDVHWAEPTFLDLLEYVGGEHTTGSILVVCTARPDILEVRPAWADPAGPARAIQLQPMDANSVRQLARAIAGEARESGTLVQRVVDAAEGNPLFAEEVVRAMLERPGDGASRAETAIPTSLLAVIAARIDRLPAEERAVARRVSIVGRSFDADAAQALIDDRPESTAEHLGVLIRRDILETDPQTEGKSVGYRFRHALIRDAAYDALAKADRAALHERFGTWVQSTARSGASEQAEIIGHHYEQAARYRREIGLDDARSAELARAAGEQLLGAGWRANQRGDPEAAVKLLGRSVNLLPEGSARRRARVAIGISAIAANRYDIGRAAVDELEREAVAADDAPSAWKARLLRESVRMWGDSAASDGIVAMLPIIDPAIAVFERAGDHHGLAIAYGARAEIAIEQSQSDAWQAASRRAIEHAVKAGDRELEEKHRGWLVAAALWGSTPITEVVRLASDELERNRSRPAIAELLQHRALAYAMRCDPQSARADVIGAGRIRSELFGPDRAMVFTAGMVEQALGDHESAAVAYGVTISALEALGETGGRSTLLGQLGLVAYDLGRPNGELTKIAEDCRRLASDTDVTSQALWRELLALVAARRGEQDRAEELISAADALMEETDDLVSRGFVARDRGRVREYLGDRHAAHDFFGRAFDLFNAKGDLAHMQAMKKLLADP